jgi:hypothetical protein
VPLQENCGRPPKCGTGRNGRPVVGLSFNASVGQYCATHAKPWVYLGADFVTALMKFRTWHQVHEEEPRAAMRIDNMPTRFTMPPELDPGQNLPDPRDLPPAEPSGMPRLLSQASYTLLPRDSLYAWARKEIHNNATGFAERVGIPQIGALQDLNPPAPSLTLR